MRDCTIKGNIERFAHNIRQHMFSQISETMRQLPASEAAIREIGAEAQNVQNDLLCEFMRRSGRCMKVRVDGSPPGSVSRAPLLAPGCGPWEHRACDGCAFVAEQATCHPPSVWESLLRQPFSVKAGLPLTRGTNRRQKSVRKR
jgi:hypothetical protein